MEHLPISWYVCLKQISDLRLIFNKGERPAKTLTTLPTLKRKVGYNDAEGSNRGERNDKRDKMEIDEATREVLEDGEKN